MSLRFFIVFAMLVSIVVSDIDVKVNSQVGTGELEDMKSEVDVKSQVDFGDNGLEVKSESEVSGDTGNVDLEVDIEDNDTGKH